MLGKQRMVGLGAAAQIAETTLELLKALTKDSAHTATVGDPSGCHLHELFSCVSAVVTGLNFWSCVCLHRCLCDSFLSLNQIWAYEPLLLRMAVEGPVKFSLPVVALIDEIHTRI